MRTVAELEAALSEPDDALTRAVADLDGDLVILGAGGKMGPSLARLARRALDRAGSDATVTAVSRFSRPGLRDELEADGVRTHAADLLDPERLADLPDASNVVYMAGTKFGTSGNEALTWAQNALLPGLVARRYRHARIVAFSTGNVYPLVPVRSGGSSERDPTGPVGEYAQSCLGRERIFEYASERHGTPVLLFRLNYAIDLRYGVLLDVARAVCDETPIDLRMGHVNVIWQGDANAFALRSLQHCRTPATRLNVTGPETVSVRRLAERFGVLLDRTPVLEGEERETALLSDASRAHALFGYPRVPLQRMVEWTAAWVREGGETLDKPTGFQQREGRF